MRLRLAATSVATLVVAAGPAAATAREDPGITSATVLLGGTVPLTGEAAAAFGSVGAGAKAYFDYVNANGGVHGRTISYRF